eukprot:756488-Hanusia_phi.AAC.1
MEEQGREKGEGWRSKGGRRVKEEEGRRKGMGETGRSKTDLCGESVLNAEPEEGEGIGDVLVEEVADHRADPVVAPPPMDQQQPLQVRKPRKRVV